MSQANNMRAVTPEQRGRQRSARFAALAVELLRAAQDDIRRRVPLGGGIERYEPAAKMRVAEAVDKVTAMLAVMEVDQ